MMRRREGAGGVVDVGVGGGVEVVRGGGVIDAGGIVWTVVDCAALVAEARGPLVHMVSGT